MSGHKYGDMNPYGICSWPAVAIAGNGISAAGVSAAAAAAAADRTGQNALFRCDHRTLVPAVGDMDVAPPVPCGDGVALLLDERASFMDRCNVRRDCTRAVSRCSRCRCSCCAVVVVDVVVGHNHCDHLVKNGGCQTRV